jgi:hypothetical protein
VLHGSKRISEQLPGDPWIYFCNDDFEFFFYFLIKGIRFVKNNRGVSLIGGVFYFVPPLEYLTKNPPVPTKPATVSLIKAKS